MKETETLKQLIDLYLTGEITNSQKIDLLQMLDNPLLSDEFTAILYDNYNSNEIPQTDGVSTLDFIAKLKNKIEAPVVDVNIAPVKKLFNWKKIVAAASIITIAGMGVFYLLSNNKKGKDNQFVYTTPKVDVTPGKAGAVLTLANGEQIVLDSAGNGVLANQSNTAVIKKDGKLIYAEGNDAKIVYNTMTTPKGRQYNLELSDGTKVWLNAASSITFPTAFTGKERKVEVKGEVYFEVAKNAGKPFKVMAEGTEIKVLGTHFNVNAYGDEVAMNTTLLEGSVELTGKNKTVVLKPGQQASVTDKINILNEADIDEVMAWKNGKFSFNDANLETIMRQVARWYNVEIVFEDKITDTYTIDVPRDVPASKLFEFIELSGGVKFKISEGKVVVRKK